MFSIFNNSCMWQSQVKRGMLYVCLETTNFEGKQLRKHTYILKVTKYVNHIINCLT